MTDFDLAQALDITCDEETPNSCCGIKADTEEMSFPYGMQLVISCNHKTMERVGTLVVAINRWKKFSKFAQSFSGKKLHNAVLESVIEERNAELLEAHGKKRQYQRVDSVYQCTLCDIAQKDLTHVSGGLKLHAITLKGGNCEQKVTFQLSRYMFTDVSAAKGQPVILSITNSNLHLTCSMQDVKAILNLEQCAESELKKISSDKNMDRFLFYKTITGMSMTKFESVSCPGWYISTSSENEDQPVEMCQADSAPQRLTDFNENRS